MSYAATHARAASKVANAGTAVTFSRIHAGTFAFATDQRTGDYTVTVAGSAVRVKGNPLQYQALGLSQAEAVTLLFAPTTYGELPELGSTATWDGATVTVKNVSPTAPDGTAILARVIVAGGGRAHITEEVASETSTVIASETDGTIA